MLITFDHVAFLYDFFMSPLEKGSLMRFRELIWRDVKGDRILEVGVGTGANRPFYPHGTVVGLDLSFKMAARARRKGIDMLVIGNVEELPFKSETFDSVVSSLVFCSVRNPEKGFSEIKRVLKKGGKFHTMEHLRPDGWKGWLVDIINPFTLFLMDERMNRKAEKFLMSIERAGFKISKDVKLTSDGLFRYFVAEKV